MNARRGCGASRFTTVLRSMGFGVVLFCICLRQRDNGMNAGEFNHFDRCVIMYSGTRRALGYEFRVSECLEEVFLEVFFRGIN